MSEDDYSRADNSVAPPHVPGKHRGPRFTWNPAYEVTFFRSLCDSVNRGLREGMTFKAEAWDRAAKALVDNHNAYANKGHLINKSDNARKKYRMWRGLRESPDFYYDPETKTITGSEEAWQKHMEREPLSRSLRGRAFEYEGFYEILFPDVIGTAGAPKRITSRKRKTMNSTDTEDQAEHDTPNTTVMNLLADATYGSNNGTMPTNAQLQHQQQGQVRQATSIPAPLPAGAQQQRPTSAALPPRNSVTTTSALTPPEETPHTRQRFLALGDQQRPDKRRRTDYVGVQPAVGPSPQNHDGGNGVNGNNGNNGINALAEALRSAKSARPGWSEQALDIFFRDFGEEDMDLQIKIAEKALAADENKAMVFCKMPVLLRKHWVKRLREVHNGHNNRT
ncbi:hypothetical protein CONLIGDRAFT_277930 [Coniochaeta ligniaria NRRL 30616]|uniref:Myb/SANT-like domain-containing protein n=1 Tax=Coniochaeta ligniaria NRRL 30616 TaxID=1408157 RepID=A0A1J7IZ51_9PEZI|nr:hypothetical protein CONLIGDRAFT_277930 [Coniochaeta ligniaria NRRL 30616]